MFILHADSSKTAAKGANLISLNIEGTVGGREVKATWRYGDAVLNARWQLERVRVSVWCDT